MELPAPQGQIDVEDLVYAHPGEMEPVLRGIRFNLKPGDSLAIVGETAAGKTTLARLLVGTLRPVAGCVRIDGADASRWPQEHLGQYIGYLPQDVELFGGTVRENIARMGDGDPVAVVKAAKKAGVHEMILRLPNGYETEIGADGMSLSGGQRQRIALARALYGSPRIVLLDEPNASLDNAGDQALIRAMRTLAEEKVTVIIIAHRPSVLKHIDYSLVMRQGEAPAFGPREEMFTTISNPAPVARTVAGA